MRVRTFTQDDAHIFMLPEQMKDEIKAVIEFIDSVYKLFGFKYHIELSTRPEDAMGSKEDWDRAETILKESAEELGIHLTLNEGDGAFYGPKLDFQLEDSFGGRGNAEPYNWTTRCLRIRHQLCGFRWRSISPS